MFIVIKPGLAGAKLFLLFTVAFPSDFSSLRYNIKLKLATYIPFEKS